MWAKFKLILLFLYKIKSSTYTDCGFFQSNSNAWDYYPLLHTVFIFHLFWNINGCTATMRLNCLGCTSFTGRRESWSIRVVERCTNMHILVPLSKYGTSFRHTSSEICKNKTYTCNPESYGCGQWQRMNNMMRRKSNLILIFIFKGRKKTFRHFHQKCM